MKWSLLLIIFLVSACSQLERKPAQNADERHIVFDIDWTIVSEIKREQSVGKNMQRMIEVQGHRYWVNEGLEELMSEILTHPEVKVSFFSGGKKVRNHELLSKIKLKNGKSLKDIAYKILNYEDLVDVEGAQSTAPFAERKKKDLTKISKDLDQLIMLDDSANFVLDTNEQQSNHVFHIGRAFEYFERFEDAKKIDGAFVPKSYDQWLLNQQKLYVIHGVFNEAYQEAKEGNVTFSAAMKKRESMVNLDGHRWNEDSLRYYRSRGKQLPMAFPSSWDCHQAMRALMAL